MQAHPKGVRNRVPRQAFLRGQREGRDFLGMEEALALLPERRRPPDDRVAPPEFASPADRQVSPRAPRAGA
eukprot:6858359-Pyramimonas_sp.AAC.1